MFYKFFDKKSSSLADKSVAKGSGIKNKIKQNEQLVEELHKPIISKFEKRKGSKFYNRSMKSWLQDNNIEMYSIHNEGNLLLLKDLLEL